MATGLVLSFRYGATEEKSIFEHLSAQSGLIRGSNFSYLHRGGASFIFLLALLHMARAFFQKSFFFRPLAWLRGVGLLIRCMAAAFLGYVLVFGQIRFWAALVITSILTVIPTIGESLRGLLWGGFSVGGRTLRRFYTLHFLVPLFALLLRGGHLGLLHSSGRTSPTKHRLKSKTAFHPHFTSKDCVSLLMSIWVVLSLSFRAFLRAVDADNYLEPSKTETPRRIVPEWYFLTLYAILRRIPSKLGGLLIVGLVLGLLFLMFLKKSRAKTLGRVLMWSFFLLTILGACHIEPPFTQLSLGLAGALGGTLLIYEVELGLTDGDPSVALGWCGLAATSYVAGVRLVLVAGVPLLALACWTGHCPIAFDISTAVWRVARNITGI